jgi:hypothetical protein
MSYEKTQKGNPHQLTVNQHIFPAKSISRFVNTSGRVNIVHRKIGKVISVKPDNQLFCAMRAWDQRAESGYMKNIEDKYQSLADSILCGAQKNIGLLEDKIVTDMFMLWNIRSTRTHSPIPDQKVKGIIDVSRKLTKDEQEHLEKNHIGFIRPDFSISGRSLSGINIQMNMDMARKGMADTQWGILTAKEGEFLVPDNFNNARILPLSPKHCLFSQSENKIIDLQEVRKINQLALENVIEFWFAKDISNCPV